MVHGKLMFRSNYPIPMTPQTQGSLSHENTFVFSMPQNKSMCGVDTVGTKGTMMSSFGMQSSTWVKNEKKSTSPKQFRNPVIKAAK